MKSFYPADIQGESKYFRYTLTRTIQSTVEIAGEYSIDCERYSSHDSKILDRGYIFTDHKNRPFMTLEQVLHFVDEDCIKFWLDKKIFAKKDHEYSHASDKLEAWERFRERLILFIGKEEISFKMNPN